MSKIVRKIVLGNFADVVRGHPLSTYAKFSEKLTFLDPLIRTRTYAYQGVRRFSFSENFAYVINGWPLNSLAFSRRLSTKLLS